VRVSRSDLMDYLGAAMGSGHGTTRARRKSGHFGLQSARRARDPCVAFLRARTVILHTCVLGCVTH